MCHTCRVSPCRPVRSCPPRPITHPPFPRSPPPTTTLSGLNFSWAIHQNFTTGFAKPYDQDINYEHGFSVGKLSPKPCIGSMEVRSNNKLSKESLSFARKMNFTKIIFRLQENWPKMTIKKISHPKNINNPCSKSKSHFCAKNSWNWTFNFFVRFCHLWNIVFQKSIPF